MRYYHEEHETAYRKIVELGYTQWNDLFDSGDRWTYDSFQNRAFLERVIPQLDLPSPAAAHVFEYGCGTGPAACFLAARGFQVEAVDLVSEAIAIARQMARERNVEVAFRVGDICALSSEAVTTRYDLILDSYCLQSIVIDEDRHALWSAVRTRLKPGGYYLIATALYTSERTYEPEIHYNAATGIVYREVPAGTATDHGIEVDGRWLIPHRRHLTAAALQAELRNAGFDIVSMETSDSAEIVCRLTL